MYRLQSVSVFGVQSNEFLLTSGVPQGKHLSSILFSLSINDTSYVVRYDSMFLCFSDDMKLFLKIKLPDGYIKLQRDMDRFVEWFKLIGLSLNIENVNVRLTQSKPYHSPVPAVSMAPP